ncbi:MAG: hypothetical protein M3530_07290 [Thermoproteota archaeon]|nr:hypothetical protein [Thermoproteota archaeon]
MSRKWNRERHTKTVHSRGASVLSYILFHDYTTTRDAKQSRSILDMPAALETGKTNDMFDEFINILTKNESSIRGEFLTARHFGCA